MDKKIMARIQEQEAFWHEALQMPLEGILLVLKVYMDNRLQRLDQIVEVLNDKGLIPEIEYQAYLGWEESIESIMSRIQESFAEADLTNKSVQ